MNASKNAKRFSNDAKWDSYSCFKCSNVWSTEDEDDVDEGEEEEEEEEKAMQQHINSAMIIVGTDMVKQCFGNEGFEGS